MSDLAILGGTPVRTRPFAVWPVYGNSERNALQQVLESRHWGTLGPQVTAFNRRFAEYSQCRFGISVTNGTATLETILRALDIGPGDEVVLPPYTFNATASSIVYVGAIPVFADIEENSYNLNPATLEAAITPRTRAIVAVHVGGRCCDMDAIGAIAAKHGLPVIEDAAHAPGSEWRGRRAGSLGTAGSFSFQASKNLTSGEGGFITTNQESLHQRCWSIHHCGRAFSGGAWYDHPMIGTNARMTEWQAAILNAQMDRLDEQIERRSTHAAYLSARLNELGFIGTFPDDERITRNSYHLYVFRFFGDRCRGLDKKTFADALVAEGIPVSTGYISLYRQTALVSADMRRRTGSTIDYPTLALPAAERASDLEGMWLGHTVLLAERTDLDDIVTAMDKVYRLADHLSI